MFGRQELDEMELCGCWDPRLIVTNVDGPLSEDQVWRHAVATEPGYSRPVLYYNRRIRGRFTEKLELKDFPVDTQVEVVNVLAIYKAAGFGSLKKITPFHLLQISDTTYFKHNVMSN